MDTSKEYIKMCEGAKEIQTVGKNVYAELPKIWKYDKGGKICVDNCDNMFCGDVWLPRQYQLQELSGHNQCDFGGLEWFYYNHFTEGDSWEVFWLELVMFEKFKKVWNGTEWE